MSEAKQLMVIKECYSSAILKLTHKKGGKFSAPPEFIVWHYTVGNAASVISAFTQGDLRSSAHNMIQRNGEVVQFVPYNTKAWHAGPSSWEEKPGCNDYTIGIEMENIGPLTYGNGEYRDVYGRVYTGGVIEEKVGKYRFWAAYTPEQLESAELVALALLKHIPTIRGMLEHSDISPGRKIDPGPAFPIERFEAMIELDRSTDLDNVYKTTTVLNLRDTPSMTGSIVLQLTPGEEVRPISSNGLWWQVLVVARGIRGWVYSKYLTLR